VKRKLGILQKLHHLTSSERGGALAELAIVVPFLAVMLAGVSEFGRFFQNYTTLAKATRSASRYASYHALNATELTRAQNLVVCGKLTCASGEELVKGFSTTNHVCIETTGAPVTSVTVRIPRISDCNPTAGSNAATPFAYQPIFNIGALLHDAGFNMAVPISPSTTMFYMAN